MRICDLNTLYIEGGAGGVNTYLREKARFLAGLDGAVGHLMILPAGHSGRSRLFNSTIHTVRSPRLPRNPHHRVLADFRAVRRILAEAQPDVVEVDSTYLLGRVAARALRRRRVPVVGFHHTHLPFLVSYLGIRRGSILEKVLERLSWRYMAICMRPLARLAVPSLDILRRLEARGVKRLEHVPLGVNLDLFQPRRESPRGPGRTVLYVGRLCEEKDIRVLFQAHEILAERMPGVRLFLAGDGPLRPLAEDFARRRGDVALGGLCEYGSDLARLYSTADVLALPGRNETFGLVALEALASGLPVAAMGRGGPLDLVTPEVGALARPGDPGDFAEKLASILDRRPTARQCRRHAERLYSWKHTFTRLLEVYAAAGAPFPTKAAIPAEAGAIPSIPTNTGVRPGPRSTAISLPSGGIQ